VNFLVAQLRERPRSGHDSFQCFRRDVFYGRDFGARQAGAAQPPVRGREQTFRRGEFAPRIETDDPLQDGVRRRAIELLMRDRVDQCLKRTGIFARQAAWPDSADQSGQHRVRFAQMFDGGFVHGILAVKQAGQN